MDVRPTTHRNYSGRTINASDFPDRTIVIERAGSKCPTNQVRPIVRIRGKWVEYSDIPTRVLRDGLNDSLEYLLLYVPDRDPPAVGEVIRSSYELSLLPVDSIVVVRGAIGNQSWQLREQPPGFAGGKEREPGWVRCVTGLTDTFGHESLFTFYTSGTRIEVAWLPPTSD